MDLDEIKQILDMMREHDLAEFELERDGVKLRLRKNTGRSGRRGAAAAARSPSRRRWPSRRPRRHRRRRRRRAGADAGQRGRRPGHRQVADRRHVLSLVRARRQAVRRGRADGARRARCSASSKR